MYVILAYDVCVERVARVLRIARKYLTWVQNSVLEGELTPAQLERLKAELLEAIHPGEDAVRFYVIRNEKCMRKVFLGTNKNEPDQFL